MIDKQKKLEVTLKFNNSHGINKIIEIIQEFTHSGSEGMCEWEKLSGWVEIM